MNDNKLIAAANKYLFCVRKDLVGHRDENESQAIDKLFENERSELMQKLSVGISYREKLIQKSRDDFAREIQSSMEKNISEYYSNLNEYVKHCNEKNSDSESIISNESSNDSEGEFFQAHDREGDNESDRDTAQNEQASHLKPSKGELKRPLKCYKIKSRANPEIIFSEKPKSRANPEITFSKKPRLQENSSIDLTRDWECSSEDSLDLIMLDDETEEDLLLGGDIEEGDDLLKEEEEKMIEGERDLIIEEEEEEMIEKGDDLLEEKML